MTTDKEKECKEQEVTCPLCTILSAFRRSQFGKHLRGAEREFWLAIRSLIDAKIDHLRDEDTAPAKKVEVQ